MADVTIATNARVRERGRISRFAAVLLLIGVLGLGLRFAGDSTRLFWTDEAITALRTAGYTGAQLVAGMTGGVHTNTELMQYVGRPVGRSLGSVVRSLAIEDAQHPPVYYLLTAMWTRVFGASIASLRAPALIFGLLVPFALGWLCFELYGTRMAAALGFALASVSPLLVIFSQQAREYGLWTAFLAASTALLLRASRSEGMSWWYAYAACCIIALYTGVLFAVVLLAQAIYGALYLRGARRRACFVAICITAVVFVPWAAAIALHAHTIALSNAWTAGPWPLAMLVEKWAFNAGTVFFDLEYARVWLGTVLLPIFALTAYAVYWNVARGPRRRRILLASLIAVQIVALFLPDLILHQHRSSVTRYGMTLWITLLVCVAGFLASRLRGEPRSRAIWGTTTLALLAIAFTSSIVDVRSPIWWDNHQDAGNLPVAQTLNAGPAAEVVVPGRWERLLDLGFYLKPDVRIMLLGRHGVARPVAPFSAGYLLGGESDRRAYVSAMGSSALKAVYVGRESNTQVRRFRGASGADTDTLTLWQFVR